MPGQQSFVLDEFAGVDLGDVRRDERLKKIVEAFVASPGSSFPELMRTAAELEAFYRFVNSDYFTFEDLTAPHARATARRIAEASCAVVVIHDPTEFTFPFDEDLREGCEQIGNTTQGFYGNVSLAVSAGSQEPLGVLNVQTWTKSELVFERPRQKKSPRHKGHGCGRIDGTRWMGFVQGAEKHVADPSKLVHVIDREADGFPLYTKLISSGRRFVIRISGERRIDAEGTGELVRLAKAARKAKPVYTIEVPLSRRSRSAATKQHPARDSRKAKLAYASMRITLKKGFWITDASMPESVTLNVVCVREVNAPKGEEPIEWLLATTEPVTTAAEVIAIVDYYRTRWKIEEFFRALKTGCAFEKRQLESRQALLSVLAMSLVLAWHTMVLRHASRARPDAPASTALSPVFLFVLQATGRIPLKKNPNLKDALYAVAAMGGHIKNNGDPGLITLSRGMEHLIERVVSFILLLQAVSGFPTK